MGGMGLITLCITRHSGPQQVAVGVHILSLGGGFSTILVQASTELDVLWVGVASCLLVQKVKCKQPYHSLPTSYGVKTAQKTRSVLLGHTYPTIVVMAR